MKRATRVHFASVAIALMLLSACKQDVQTQALYQLQIKPLREQVRARGEVVSTKLTTLNVPGQGFEQRQVLQILADGSRVKKGDLIAVFEARASAKELSVQELELIRNGLQRIGVTQQVALNSAQLSTEIAEVEGSLSLSQRYADAAEQSELSLSKNELLDQLQDLGFLSTKRETLAWREGQVQVRAGAEMSLNSAQRATIAASVAQKKASLASMELRAPHDGVLRLNSSWDGSKAQVGSAVWAGNDFAVLPDSSALVGRFSLPQVAAEGLKQGQKARLRVAGSGVEFDTVVARVSASASIKSRESPVKYLDFDVAFSALDLANNPLTPGQALQVEVELVNQAQALVVPNVALVSVGEKFRVQQADGSWIEVKLAHQGSALSAIATTPGVTPSVRAGDWIRLNPERNEANAGFDDMPAATPARRAGAGR